MTADDQPDGDDGDAGAEETGPNRLVFDLVTAEQDPETSQVPLIIEPDGNGGLRVEIRDASDDDLTFHVENGVKPKRFGEPTWRGTIANKIEREAVMPDGIDVEQVRSNFDRRCSDIGGHFEEKYSDALRSNTIDVFLSVTDAVKKRKGDSATVEVYLERGDARTSHEFTAAEWRTGSEAEALCHTYWSEFDEDIDIADEDEWQMLRSAWEDEHMVVSASEDTSPKANAVERARRYLQQHVTGAADLSAMDTNPYAAWVDPDPGVRIIDEPTAWVGLEAIADAIEAAGKDPNNWSSVFSPALQEAGDMRSSTKQYRGRTLWPFDPAVFDIDVEQVLADEADDGGDGDDEDDEVIGV